MGNELTKNKGLTRRDLLSRSVATGLSFGVLPLHSQLWAQAAVSSDSERDMDKSMPNVLWICTDQQRYDTIAALGNPLVHTPSLDGLVSQGVTFTHAFAQSTVCTPSRAAFMTSRYPHLTGARGNGFNIRNNEVPITKRFQDFGYYCGLIGKLHLSACQNRVERRIDDGYAEFMWSHGPAENGMNNHYHQWLSSKGYQWKDIYRQPEGKYTYAGVSKELHQTTWCFEKAMEFVSRNQKKPWFLSINVYAPHHPFDPSEEYLRRYDPSKMPDPLYQEGELDNKPPNQTVDHHGAYGFKDWMAFSQMTPNQRREITAAYYAMIEQTDEQIGLLLQRLQDAGQEKNTIVVFTSDHGEMLGNHGIYLKGHYPYEDLIHIPLILVWPGHFKAGLQSDALVELVDIAPTLLAATGQAIPVGMQGRSLLEICGGRADPHNHRGYVFTECYEATPTDKPPVYVSMIRDRRYKISVYHGQELGELYDLHEDPHEFNNLWNSPEHEKMKNKLLKKCFDATIDRLDPLPQRIAVF